MRKTLIAALAVLAAMVTSGMAVAADPNRVSYDDLLKVTLQQSDLTAADFEKARLPDGRNSVRSQKPSLGLMISFIGPADDVSEVVALARMEKETFLRHELLLTALAMKAANWEDGFKVVPDLINELAQKNGGKRQVTINGRVVAVAVVPPNLVSINVVKR